jgi:hypothetical protein
MRKPAGETRDYGGVRVVESTYSYAGVDVVPSWGGSMFEALMPDLLVPEAEWGPGSWGKNHRATVAAQKHHGLALPESGYWGWSPSADPAGGYGAFGVPALSIASTLGDHDRLSGGAPVPPSLPSIDGRHPDSVTDAVVTPHASFLALAYDARGALDNLERLADDAGAYGSGGFYDAVDVRSGAVASSYLSLDQSMVLGSIGNAVADGLLQRYFVDESFEERIRPLVAEQVFGTTAE